MSRRTRQQLGIQPLARTSPSRTRRLQPRQNVLLGPVFGSPFPKGASKLAAQLEISPVLELTRPSRTISLSLVINEARLISDRVISTSVDRPRPPLGCKTGANSPPPSLRELNAASPLNCMVTMCVGEVWARLDFEEAGLKRTVVRRENETRYWAVGSYAIYCGSSCKLFPLLLLSMSNRQVAFASRRHSVGPSGLP